MGVRQTVLNWVNTALRSCSLDIASLWGRQHEIMIFSDALMTGRNSAANAFAGYLAFHCSQAASSNQITPEQIFAALASADPALCLAGLARETASEGGALIDAFIRFYALNFEMGRSQWSQDIFVMFITHQKVHGRYLEVGGANGVTHSNTISLRDNNSWSGILVEPHPLQFSDLKRFRGHSDSLHSVALTPQSAESHQLLIDMGQLSALQDLAPNDEHAATRSKAGRLHRVRTEPLDAFLRQAGKIDYFSLDVEGAELELVKCMVQKTEFRPPVMTIEHNFRDDRDIVKELMESAGYVECFSSMPWLTRGDAWFVLQDVLKTFH